MTNQHTDFGYKMPYFVCNHMMFLTQDISYYLFSDIDNEFKMSRKNITSNKTEKCLFMLQITLSAKELMVSCNWAAAK